MRRILAFVLAALLPIVALAQSTSAPVGQTNGGAINQAYFNANTDTAGFNDTAMTPALAVPTTSTAQAAWVNGVVASGTLITTRTTIITACSATTGPTLPSVQRYVSVTLLNRSGGSCLIFPSLGATLETAPGTAGAVNAPFTMLTNTDVIFRPASATAWLQ